MLRVSMGCLPARRSNSVRMRSDSKRVRLRGGRWSR